MRFISMSAKNFMSFSELEYSFRSGIHVVHGVNLDEFNSNGAGKTSFVELIYWVIFANQLRKGSSPVRDGETDCFGSITFEIRGTQYTITRTAKAKKTGTEVSLYSGGVNRSKGTTTLTNNLIVETVGMDQDLFRSLVLFGGGSHTSFASMTDATQKNLLNQILKIQEWEEYKKRTTDRIKQQNQVISAMQSKVSELRGQLHIESTRAESLKRELESLVPPKDTEDSDRVIQDLEYAIEVQRKKIQETEERGRLIDTLESSIQEKKEALTTLAIDLQNYRKEESLKVSNIQTLQSQLRLYESGKCPTCNQTVSPHGDDVGAFADNLGRVKSELRKLVIQIEDKQAQISSTKAWAERTQANLESIKSNLKDIGSMKDRLQEMQIEKAEVKSFNERLQEKMAAYKAQKATISKYLRDTECSILDIRKNLIEQESELSREVKEKETLQEIETMFSRAGIPSLILRNIEEPINQLLSQFMYEFGYKSTSVKLQTQRELKGGGIREELDIVIERGTGKDCHRKSYYDLSEGEKRRVDLVFFLTLLSLYELSGSVDLLIYDEVLDRIDKEGADCLFTVLRKNFKKKCVLVTTPTQNLDWRSDSEIKITKHKGVSCLSEE
jgi:DNA repair exonuclease SbcCD ATPase subunit